MINQETRELLRDDHILYVEPYAEGIAIYRWDNDMQKVTRELLEMNLDRTKFSLDYYHAHTTRKDEAKLKRIAHPAYNSLVRAQRIEMKKRRT